jgi:aspartyl-tRNA(Asn)/glutamyl-tRNA(Gln) amidotransferase subunit A
MSDPASRNEVRTASDEVAYLSASMLHDRFCRGDASPVDVAMLLLDRIEAMNPQFHAYVTVAREEAMSEARTAERLYREGVRDRPLLGVPVSIKDMTMTMGLRTTFGSLTRAQMIPAADAPIVERLRRAGVVILGKTNTPEFGWKGESSNRLGWATRNPWKPGVTAGGSSGGAAAAVALGLGPLAQGSDGAGSIRIPASFCGVVGFKPSFGLIPYWPASPVGILSHVGPIARTVRDAALFVDAVAGEHWRDATSAASRPGCLSQTLTNKPAFLRIAWAPRLLDTVVDEEVEAICSNAARVFDDLGYELAESSVTVPDPHEHLEVVWSSGQAAVHRTELPEVRHLLDPGRLEIIDRASRWAAADLAAAELELREYREVFLNMTRDYDVLLTPTVPTRPFTVGLDRPPGETAKRAAGLGWTPFTYVLNVTGQPAVTVPAGWTRDGMPVGLQIAGGWRRDDLVVQMAAQYEEARPWAHVRPPSTPG